MDTLPWPATTLPRLTLAGQFPLGDQGFATRYLGPTHALHLHGYAGRMRLGGEEFELQPGDLTLSPAGTPSGYDLPRPGRHWCVHFQPEAAMGPAVALPLWMRLGSAGAYAVERLTAISRLHARGDVLAQASAAVAFHELLLWCVGRTHENGNPAEAIADQVGAIVDARFAQPFTAESLAHEVGRSQNYVARAFRLRFGMTVPHYSLRRRLSHAQYLLESTELPVGQIAKRVGIEDPHYFNKLVRRFLGHSPTALRRRAHSAAPQDIARES